MLFARHCKASVAFLTLVSSVYSSPTEAADHGEAPIAAYAVAADIADVFFFLDPNDNSRVVLGLDVHGFIVPAENASLGNFDPTLRYRIQIENTGDARGDAFIDVTFSRLVSRDQPQTATIVLPNGGRFSALTTPSSSIDAVAFPPTVTIDPNSGVAFFAGLTDDPFFFDIPAELGYRSSRFEGHPDPSRLTRGRDTFAGYNVDMIALSVPADLLRGSAGDVIGITAFVQRNRRTTLQGDGTSLNKGPFVTVDRMGIPAINTMFVPFARRDEYNAASTPDDASGRFAADIVTTLRQLGTDQTSIAALTEMAVVNGDILRLDLSVANAGAGGGTNAEAGFPNGRRPCDDVMDTILTLVNNRAPQGDAVGANEVPLRSTFPFFASPHQPFAAGVTDDLTRN